MVVPEVLKIYIILLLQMVMLDKISWIRLGVRGPLGDISHSMGKKTHMWVSRIVNYVVWVIGKRRITGYSCNRRYYFGKSVD